MPLHCQIKKRKRKSKEKKRNIKLEKIDKRKRKMLVSKCTIAGGLLEYETVGEFLADIKKKFGGGDEESVKVAEFKRLEQGGKTIEEFVQEF